MAENKEKLKNDEMSEMETESKKTEIEEKINENMSVKTINLYEKKMDEMTMISDLTEINNNRLSFEVIEKYKNKRKINYIYKGLSLVMFNAILDRGSDGSKYTKEAKRECYLKIKKYCENLLKNNLTMRQIYIQSECYRYYTKGNMSLQYLPNEIRGFLCEGEMTDIDIRNGQPTIIYWLCKKNGIECPYLEKYVKEREEILEKTKLEKMDYIISMNTKKCIYGKKDEFYRMFDKEMKIIQKKLIEKLSKDEEYKNIIDTMEKEKKELNLEGCFLNRVYFKHESEIITYIKSTLNESTYEIASYNYDGVMIYGDYYEDKELEKKITENTINQFGLPEEFRMVFKRHKNVIEIPEDWKDEEDKEMNEEEYFENIYKLHKIEFEKTFFKLNTSPIRYCEEINLDNNKDLKFYTKNDLVEYLMDKYKINNKNYDFCKKWRLDPTKRSYNNIVFEPDKKKFNENNYNFYTGFENYDEEIEPIKEEESKFLILLKYICKDKNVYDIFKLWIHHIITKPYKKTNVGIILYSKYGGVGKNAIVDGIIELIGKKYRALLNKIEELDKTFNSNFCNKFFCYGDEIKTNAKNFSDEVKKCITRPEENYERKNIDPITISDYKNYLFTTNNKNAFKIEENERRLLMIECPEKPYGYKKEQNNEENILNSQRFYNEFYGEIQDSIKIKQLFKFFYNYKMENEELKNFEMGKSRIIMTDYKKELEIEQMAAYVKYIYCNTEYLCFIKKIYSRNLYEDTMEYAKKNYMSSNYTITEFGSATTKYLQPFKKRDNKGIYFEFTTEEILLEHLKSVDNKYYKFIFEEGEEISN